MATKVTLKGRLANKHQPAIAAFFRAQCNILLNRLGSRSLAAEVPKKTQLTLSDFEEVWDSVEVATDPKLQEVITKAEVDGFHAGATQFGKAFKGKVPFDFSFNLNNPRAVAWFRANGGSLDYIAGIQRTTKAELQTIITDSLEKGESYQELARRIRAKYEQYAQKLPGKMMSRSQLIAVTETAVAYEEGNMQFAQGLKEDGVVVEKMWKNSGDDKVSDGCLENTADGWIPIDQPHSSGDDQPPRFPGCRCWEEYREVENG